MSFFYVVSGLTSNAPVVASHVRPWEDFAAIPFEYSCGEFTCLEKTEISGEYSVDVSALAASIPPADYYAIGVGFGGPADYQGGTLGCTILEAGSVCGPIVLDDQTAAIEGDFASPGSGNIVPSEGEVFGDAFRLGITGLDLDDPDRGYAAYWLVNPSPTLAVPLAGNYFTQVLFTAGQLPAAITAEVIAHNIGQANLVVSSSNLTVGLTPYNITSSEVLPYSCIIGSA